MDTPRRPPAFDRAEALARLAAEQFDVLVVGGGITGAGVALDAASRGLRTALVERDDFASGTSSKSSKLVHGGLRYLQQREVGLVYEGLAERQIALRNAPHLVRILPFLIPVLTKDGVISRRLARALGGALWMYDLTGGLRIGKRHKRVSSDQAVAHMQTLRADRVAGGYLYYDAHTDDARLTLTLCRTAAAHGAVVANYAGVTSLRKDGKGRVRGARVQADGDEVDVRADVVVNAAGVWTDDVRALDEPSHPHSIRPAKGIHITVPWSKVRNDIAVVVPVAKDRRSVFVVPWGDLTYVGTTDTDYDGPLDDPECTPDDVAYLLRALNAVIDRPGPRGRRAGHVGGAAAVAAHRRQRPHRRPVPPARGAPLGGRPGDGHGREAHDVPADGRRHRRRGRRAAREAAPLPHQTPEADRRRRLRGPARDQRAEPARAPRPPLRHRRGSGRGARRPGARAG